MPYIGKVVAFYPFLKFQDEKLGTTAEKGFNWIMESDNTKATAGVAKILKQVKSEIPDNPNVKMMIVQMLENGLAKKTELLRANPKSESINQQIKLLTETLELYK